MTSKGAGTADLIRKFSYRPIPFESNRMGQLIRIRIESQSFAGPKFKHMQIHTEQHYITYFTSS